MIKFMKNENQNLRWCKRLKSMKRFKEFMGKCACEEAINEFQFFLQPHFFIMFPTTFHFEVFLYLLREVPTYSYMTICAWMLVDM